MVKKVLVCFGLFLVAEAATVGADGYPMSPPSDFSSNYQIEIPGAIEPTSQDYLTLRSTKFTRINIQILRPEADRMAYGQITPSINGAAAARISTIRPNGLGKRIELNLQAMAGFNLNPGANKVDVFIAGEQQPRKSFTLHTPKGICSNGSYRILSLDQLARKVRSGEGTNALVDLVLDCGLDFVPTADTDAQLRDAGADGRLIEAIHSPTDPKFADHLRNALTVDRILTLLRSGAPEEKIKERVERDGVSFPFTDDVQKQFEAANITKSLEREIAEMAGGSLSTALSYEDVLLLLQNGGTDRIAKLVDERGINFRMDAEAENDFRSAKADEIVMQKLRDASERYERSH